ncbi:MAG: Bug family tripartite tricarboxylate transporter substrate binding protein [Burkholderiales bacterium]
MITMKALQRLICILPAVLAGVPLAAPAQDFPKRPISIVVPFAPGGPVDLIPRTIAPKLSASMGVPVIVENKPGSAGNVGAAQVSRADPDGYSLLLFHSALFTVNPWLFKNLPFNPATDLTPISDLASMANVMVVNSEIKANTLSELMNQIRAKPGEFNYGTPGVGTSSHLCVEFFKLRGGNLDLVHVPFKGGPAAVTGLLSNQVQLGCVAVNAALPSVKAKRLRPLAVTSLKRSAAMPDVQTMDEAGLKGFEVTLWFGIAAPAKTPEPIIRRLNKEVLAALKDEDVVKRLHGMDMSILGDTPENVKRNMAAESANWRGVIEKANVRITQ